MSKIKNHPLWLKIAMKLPLSWKHCIREKIQMAEFWSNTLVIEDSAALLLLIEGTDNPDFAEFDRRLDIIKKAWGKQDAWLEDLSARKSLLEFRKKNENKRY